MNILSASGTESEQSVPHLHFRRSAVGRPGRPDAPHTTSLAIRGRGLPTPWLPASTTKVEPEPVLMNKTNCASRSRECAHR
ncbi:hypothetical protein ACIQU4_40110 [Streptomyces sp. NPDC090741]|uniref:hypothetical protein n=1 Tax=Streptomyces sp. NPDC090741 TaxID=3365967 RepID=UPI0037F4210A